MYAMLIARNMEGFRVNARVRKKLARRKRRIQKRLDKGAVADVGTFRLSCGGNCDLEPRRADHASETAASK